MLKLEINEDLFKSYSLVCGILVIKMLIMSALTARQRFAKLIFLNPEDITWNKKAKVTYDDPDIERIRRAHMNDVENILPFFVIALLYCFTHPDPTFASLLFKVFAGARIAHTFVYAIVVIPQPSRGLAWGIGHAITYFLAFQVILYHAF